jgi:hypothetical protein
MSIDRLLTTATTILAVAGVVMMLAGIWHDIRWVATALLTWTIAIVAFIARLWDN